MIKTDGDLRAELSRALEASAAAAALNRTVDITSVNDSTRYTIELALGQGLDERPVCDPPYVRDTGVTVCGTNVTPGTRQAGQIQLQINVSATRVKWSCHWRNNVSGYEGDLTAADLVCDSDHYWQHPTFGVKDPSKSDREARSQTESSTQPPDLYVTFAAVRK